MIEFKKIPSPAFVLEEKSLRRNLEILKAIRLKAGVEIILAFKAFAMWPAFPLVRQYLDGATASSLNEALLCAEEMKKKAHLYAPAYSPKEFEQLLRFSSHLTFNSLNQFYRFEKKVKSWKPKVSVGLRINPGYSAVETDLYNPCAPGTRLGVSKANMPEELPAGIEGLHFHSLCESDSFELEKTLAIIEQDFGKYFKQLKWINFGGGHAITRKDYDVEHLVKLLLDFKQKTGLKVILEPGSAIAWDAGFLLTEVLDIVEDQGIKTAMLDISFTAHVADALEMPFKPKIKSAIEPEGAPHVYRMGGISCLSGDYIGNYGFTEPLEIGQRLVIEDMIHYTMVKTTMFNGVQHPAIGTIKEDGQFVMNREFDYQDFKKRLG